MSGNSNVLPFDFDLALYKKIRSTFTPVKPSSKEEFWELMSSVFAGGSHWTEQSDHYYLELEHPDPARPLKRILEQKPTISRAVFLMTEDDMEDKDLFRYAEQELTQSRGNLLWVNFVMTWFFFYGFGLLPECCLGRSKEKRLERFTPASEGLYKSYWFREELRDRRYRKCFNLSPIVFCGPLRPSELLDRAEGHKSVVIFPFNCIERNDETDEYRITAYLIEFPNPIEGLFTFEEMQEILRAQEALFQSITKQ